MSTIFNAPKNGTLNGIKLHYINNSLSFTPNISTYWEYPLQTFLLHVTNSTKFIGETYYPLSNTQNVNLTSYNSTCKQTCILSYTIQNYNINNSINYTLLNPTYNVSTNDQFMLQHSQYFNNNITNSTTCATIYFLYTTNTKPPTVSPTVEPTSKISEFGLDIIIKYYLHSNPSHIENTLIDITKTIITANLSTNKTGCITDIYQHHIYNMTSKTLTIEYIIMICSRNIQQSLYEQYNNHLKQLLMYKINTTTNIYINSYEILINITSTDSGEAANPTQPMITTNSGESINPTHSNTNKYKSSKVNSKAVLFVIIAVIFILTILAIGIYLKRKAIVVQLNLKDLKVGLLSGGECASGNNSRELLRCDTLPASSNTIFENKPLQVSHESFELICNPNDSIIPGSIKKRSSVKLSVVRYDDRMDGFYVKAITDYNDDTGEDQLNFKENAIFWVVQTTESGWWYAIDEMGYDGWIPSNYVIQLDKKERAELKQQQEQKTSGESYINLLTELMDKSYNKVKENGMIFGDIPGIIAPPMNVTGGGDIISSSSSEEQMDLHNTIGSVTRSDKY